MTYIVPKIDQRSQQDVAGEIRRLMLEYCPEYFKKDNSNNMNTDEIESDKQAEALIQIFSTMMGHVIDALNQSPEKNYTAFLNLIGVSPTAPKVAKAPIQFKLKKDWDKETYIPSGTRISAQPDNQEEVIFETENDLIVIRPELVRAACIEPGADQWSNLSSLLSTENIGEYAELFNGHTQILHRMYIGHSKLQSMKEAEMNLSLTLNTGDTKDYAVEWFCFDDKGNPQHLCSSKEGIEESLGGDEKKYIYFQSSPVKFPDISGVSLKALSGYDKSGLMNTWKSNWIYAELKTPIDSTGKKPLPEITDIRMNFSVPEKELPLDAAVSNYSQVDLTKDFYPFGDRPAFNDTFYIACREAFSKVNSEILVDIVLSQENKPDTKNIILSWEYWNGIRWAEIGKLNIITTYTIEKVKDDDGNDVQVKKENTSIGKSGGILEDTTKVFTKGGHVKFMSPGIVASNVNGEENYWIRVRITGGDYGKDGFVDYVDKDVSLTTGNSVSLKQVAYTPPTFKAPSIQSLTIKYSYTLTSEVPDIIITENNFVMSAVADNSEKVYTEGYSFKPFLSCDDDDPAFYLAFDRDISNLPLSLFFPLSGDQAGLTGKDTPVVGWEYWNGRRWLTLSVNDAIRDFTRREIQQITIPADLEKCPLFGTEHYWIRARLENGGYKVAPKINAVYSNVVWAGNSNTITGEMLGSSNGEPSQTFQFSRTPVLQGQVVKVHETLGREEWTKWEEVQTFSLSETDSRHYMLDSESGTLVFGDGKNGMIPPAGTDNIQCDYNYGGGIAGNVKENTISKIWDDFPAIESAYNPIAADGGFDQEETEAAKARGPYTLKNRDRGVTSEDIEWLVREAAPQIAIVRCFPTMNTDLDFAAGEATVIVVPEYKASKPVPSQELLNEIDEYLSERISTVLQTSSGPKLNVIGPDYVRVGVEANIQYSTPEFGKIIEGSIIDRLKQFLDPLYGGQERTGWKLGKNLYISEICSEIKNTPGVDYISSINVNSSVQCYTLYLEPMQDGAYKPAVSYPAYSAVKTSDNRIVFALAQKLQANKGVKALSVRGFRENETINLIYRNHKSKNLKVISVEGDILECRTADEEPLTMDYPVGSDVEAVVTKDLTIRSFILNEITGNSTTFFIKIAIPEIRDTVYLSRNDEYNNTISLKIKEVRSENIFLEEDELVYSGVHLINKKPELKFPYLMNDDTKVIHDLSNTNPQCCLGDINKEDRKYLQKLTKSADTKKCWYCLDGGITAEDIEWLVREAALQIAIVKCLPAADTELDFATTEVIVIVVPESNNPKPVPSQKLLDDLLEYLYKKLSAVLKKSISPRIKVTGPDYIRVGIKADVSYAASESAKDIEALIVDNLNKFLNPLYGGKERTGWKTGDNLLISEISSEIKSTHGVASIGSISVESSVQSYTLYLEPPKEGTFIPAVSYPSGSTVKTGDNKIVFALAQKLQANVKAEALLVKGFRENQTITLKCKNYMSQPLTVISVEGDILECRTTNGQPLECWTDDKKSIRLSGKDYTVGSCVEAVITKDMAPRSYIMNDITGNPKSFSIKIALPEAQDSMYLSCNDENNTAVPLKSLKIKEVRSEDIILEDGELVYSGVHLINKKPELKFPYLMNNATKAIHDLSNAKPECCVGQINKEDRKYLQILPEGEGTKCSYCFKT